MKQFTIEQLNDFLKSLAGDYDLRVPVVLHDGTRSIGSPDEGDIAVLGGKLPVKPTTVFFPQFDNILTVSANNKIQMASSPEKPILAIGFTAEDLDCLEFIDEFFAADYRDVIYFNKREKSIVIGVSGKCGKNGEFLKIAGSKCDAELIYDGNKFVFAPYTETGNALAEKISGDEIADINGLIKESESLPQDGKETIIRASEILSADKVPDEFWEEIADQCIACTSCNYACPSCTCFEVYDRELDNGVQRCRMWDSCQLDGFMREASGHNPMSRELTRTHRRIHHKLVADLKRWGTITCFSCGRCDDVCPTGIGIKSVSEKIVDLYG